MENMNPSNGEENINDKKNVKGMKDDKFYIL